MKEKICFSWSSGKDSCLALYKLLSHPQYSDYEVNMLFTTISEYDRVSFHGVHRILIEAQAHSLNLPIYSPVITTCNSVKEFTEKLEKELQIISEKNIKTLAYGDIFLEELRADRLKTLSKFNMSAIFPIWKHDSKRLLTEFLDLGFKAIITCIDSKVLDKSFVGRVLDYNFINDLPPNVDICGENGEFHTFVFDGPIFREPVLFTKGDISLRNSFYYIDLLPDNFEKVKNKINHINSELYDFIGLENINHIKDLTATMQEETIKLYFFCKNENIHFDIISGRRTYFEQKSFYDEYIADYPHDMIGIPGESCHELGRSIDIKVDNNLSYSEKHKIIGTIWEKIGHYWGGNDSIKEYWHLYQFNHRKKRLFKLNITRPKLFY
ncbi:MAG: hypothetical protein WCK67_09220 [bacterium]